MSSDDSRELGGGEELAPGDTGERSALVSQEGLQAHARHARESLGAGESFERATANLSGWLRGVFLGELRDARWVTSFVGDLVERARPVLGELADDLLRGLAVVDGLLGDAERWLRENPVTFQAGVRVTTLAALAAGAPEALRAIVTDKPALLTEALATLLGATA